MVFIITPLKTAYGMKKTLLIVGWGYNSTCCGGVITITTPVKPMCCRPFIGVPCHWIHSWLGAHLGWTPDCFAAPFRRSCVTLGSRCTSHESSDRLGSSIHVTWGIVTWFLVGWGGLGSWLGWVVGWVGWVGLGWVGLGQNKTQIGNLRVNFVGWDNYFGIRLNLLTKMINHLKVDQDNSMFGKWHVGEWFYDRSSDRRHLWQDQVGKWGPYLLILQSPCFRDFMWRNMN